MSQPFRIQSLDGGGIMGRLRCRPGYFERETEQRIIDHIDLITGTSTGGIIAIGLAMETPAEEIARFYETEEPKIFPKRSGINKWLREEVASSRGSRTKSPRGHPGGRREIGR